MKLSKIITFAGRDVTCKELTIAEIDRILNSAAEVTTLDLIFSDRLPLAAVTLSTGIGADALHELPVSEVTKLWSGVEEVNPFFAATLKRLAELGRQVIKSPARGH